VAIRAHNRTDSGNQRKAKKESYGAQVKLVDVGRMGGVVLIGAAGRLAGGGAIRRDGPHGLRPRCFEREPYVKIVDRAGEEILGRDRFPKYVVGGDRKPY